MIRKLHFTKNLDYLVRIKRLICQRRIRMNEKLSQVLCDIENNKIESSHIHKLIDIYYQCVIDKIDECENDEEMERAAYPEDILLQLPQRKSGIFEALSQLIDQGYDVHESDGGFNALMLAVGYADEPMTAFLIDNGADPRTWPDMDEFPTELRQNYYLEDIDIQYMDTYLDKDEKLESALLRTAQTIVKASGLKNFGGICLCVDENGNVSLKPPKMKY